MALVTAGDLVNYAFRISGISGVGQGVSADDMNDGLTALGAIIASWQQQRWMAWDLLEAVFTSTGAATYTVGPTGNFVMPRPDRIDDAFARLLPAIGANAMDYPIGIVTSREQFNRIGMKNMVSWPQAAFYESAYPVGLLHLWPLPSAGQFELHIFTKSTLPVYSQITDLLAVPPEYMRALIYSLVVELTMNYGQEPKPAHVRAMSSAIGVIKAANVQMAPLSMPAGLPGVRRGWAIMAPHRSGAIGDLSIGVSPIG